MTHLDLINKCYENDYGIDLKAFHKKAYENTRAELSFEILQRPINFNDSISDGFDLIIHEGLIYLLGNKSCYPCSPLVHSVYGIDWVPIILLPTGKPIRTENDIRNSSVIYMNDFINSIDEINNVYILDFLQNFQISFKDNSWFNNGFQRKVISSRGFHYDFILKYLKDNNLLTVFELSFMSIYYNDELDYIKLFKSLNFDNNSSKIFSHIRYLGKQFKLSKSLQEIVSSDYFINFLKELSNEQLNDFFETDFLDNHILLNKISQTNLLDVFQIEILSRYYKNYELKIENIIKNLNEINITESLLEEFNSRILKNIKNLENTIRKLKGYPEIGGNYREIIVLNFFKENLPQYKVTSQYSPNWLIRQRFDVYIHELNIAIEYNGKQHYEAISFFGGEEGLKLNQKRDLIKQEKCIQNDCKLYVIKYNENLDIKMNKILNEISRLYNN